MSDQTPTHTVTEREGTPCICLTTPAYTLDGDDGYLTEETVYGPCGRLTTREFAPGHDAKLKSLLQALYVSGSEYHRLEGGMLVSGDPYAVAASRDWTRFLDSARDIATRQARKAEAAKQAKEAKRAATLAKRAAAKEARKAAQAEDAADDATIEAARTEVEHQIAAEDAEERNVQVGDQVRITVRGREVDGEVTKVDATVARVRYLTTKGEESVAVKPLRDLR